MTRIPHTFLTAVLAVAPAACLDGSELDPASFRYTTIDFGQGPVELEIRDAEGEAILDGDIILGPIDEIGDKELVYGPGGLRPAGAPVSHAALSHLNPWPGGRIPFVIDASLPDAVEARIQQAISDWNSQTVVRLVPRPARSNEHFVRFTGPTSDMGAGEGRSAIGYQPGTNQLIRLGSNVSVGTIRHEIGHTVGLFHEQSRTDRDNFIRINMNEVQEGAEGNFETYVWSGLVGLDFGAYDLNSLMHYGSFTFAAGSRPVIVRAGCSFTTRNPDCFVRPSSSLTELDRKGVTRLVSGDPIFKFRIRNEATNQCLRPLNGSTEVGARVILSTCSNTASRRWYEYKRAGASAPMLINEHSRLCLARDSSMRLVQAQCNGAASQSYQAVDAGWFVGQLLRASSRCATRVSGSSWPTMSTSCSTTTANKRWFRDFI